LLDYCQQPSAEERLRLETVFDSLFTNITGYDALDQRIAKTNAKKNSSLLVLQYPELPLHNNNYLVDRITGTNQIQPLADLISLRANELNLGWSFTIS
jgi:hypothetical protein